MSYSVVFAGDDEAGPYSDPFLLCSVGSWEAFGKAVRGSLPPNLPLALFVEAGTFKGTDALRIDLERFVHSDPGVAATRDAFLQLIGDGRPDETATLEG